MTQPIDVLIVGGGMITADLILPATYHLRRLGTVGAITVCARHSRPLKALENDAAIAEAFPGQSFTAMPATSEPPERAFPEMMKEAIASLARRQAVVVATPDQTHFEIVMEALGRDQHVLCVKPLVLEHAQALEIERFARDRGLFVGVEYHKRFDRRSLVARREYRMGRFGEFVCGEAKLVEPYFYRHSNFQNWFSAEETDPFVYIGCHYVDLVAFITGLRPTEVSVAGTRRAFPNGVDAWMWAHGRVRFENGALLNVLTGLGYPDDGAGSNDQGLQMFCEGEGRTGLIRHDDQFRGVQYSYLEGVGCGGSRFNFVNPDFFRYVPWEGEGAKPTGYGPDSVMANLEAIHRIEAAVVGLDETAAKAKRVELTREIDERGLIATPANSAYNELVVEAARRSIMNDGANVRILHDADPPRVE